MALLHALLLRFHRRGFWASLALVALTGWTVDAIIMFLRMHGGSLQAGLGNFVSHFWYAVPVALAVQGVTSVTAACVPWISAHEPLREAWSQATVHSPAPTVASRVTVAAPVHLSHTLGYSVALLV